MNPYDYIQDNLTNKRLSLVLHPASIAPDRLPWLNYFLKNPEYEVVRVFGPQHGLHGHTQDNMIEWEGKDFASEPFELISLYGEHRQPTSEMLQNLDAIFFDLQDVGARYYTFIWTLFLLMEALHERSSSVQLYVYDRPNPINGIDIEGPLLDPQYRSFVGLDQIPIRHGLTIGEMALFFQSRFSRVHLNIIQMSGWKRSSYAGNPDGRYWVMPSPNMPTPDTALVYPGQCLLEATNVSEGRGTTRPFEIFGAPWIDADKMCKYLNQQTAGCYFQPWAFQPTFHKYANQTCFGAFIHVTDRKAFRPVATTFTLLSYLLADYPDKCRFNEPPYEYEYEKLPIDILTGHQQWRELLLEGPRPASFWSKKWTEDELYWQREREKFMLYG
jgi:uncharacterized protein YbbC (DUF1343 family)